MKKVLCAILALTMLFSLVACAKEAAPTQTTNNDTSASDTAATTPADTSSTEDTASETGYHKLYSVPDLDMVNGMLMPSDVESRASIDKGLPTESKSGLKIGLCQATLSNPYFVAIADSAKEHAEEYGYELIIMNAETDGDQMIAICEAFLAQGVDAIILDPCDVKAANTVVAECVAQDVPVVGIGGALDPACATVTSILANNFENGWQAGLVGGEAMKDYDSISAVVIIGLAGFANSKSRICGEVAGMIYTILNAKGTEISINDARYLSYGYCTELFNSGKTTVPEINMTIGGYGEGSWTDEGGLTAMEDLMTANPDVQLVLAENDWMAMGAIKAIKAAGKTPGTDVLLISAADGSQEAMDCVKSGELLCTGYNPPDMLGGCAVDLIHMIFEEGFDASNMPAGTSLDAIAITKDNVDQYYDSPTGYVKAYDIVWKSIDDLAATADFS